MNVKPIQTESDLRLYLEKKHWTHLLIKKSMTLAEPIDIHRDLTIVCSKDAIITSNVLSGTQRGSALFNVYARYVGFLNVGMFGGTMEPLFSLTNLQTGVVVECLNARVSFEGCTISGFNHAGIWQLTSDVVTVNDCKLLGSSGSSYNYGIWQGGDGDLVGQSLFLLNSESAFTRHVIGASGHKNHYFAIKNIIHNTIRHAFDRHNLHEVGYGGLNTIIKNNIFLEENRLAFGVEHPYAGGLFEFTGNKLNHHSSRHIGEISGERVYENYIGYRTKVSDNIFTDTK